MTLMNFLFWGIPLIALATYLLLFIFFIFARKDAAIKAFMLILGFLALWVASSLAMKLQLYPGTLYWNRMMVTAFFTLPFLIYIFLEVITKTINKSRLIFLGLITAIGIVINLAGYVVTSAEMIITDPGIGLFSGRGEFSYTLGWGAIVCCVFYLLVLLLTLLKSYRLIKKGAYDYEKIKFVLIGAIIMFLGISLNLITAVGKYPVDILASFINAILIVVAIYKKRMFELRLVLSQGMLYFLLAAFATTCYVLAALEIQQFLNQRFNIGAPYVMAVLALLVALILHPIYSLLRKLVGLIFRKAEYNQRVALQNFSVKVANKLDLEYISEELLLAVCQGIRSSKCLLLLRDGDRGDYAVYRTSLRLESPNLRLDTDNPLIKWLGNNDRCLMTEDFDTIPAFKAMWDKEKQEITSLGVEVIVPIKCRNELIGLLLLARKVNNTAYTYEDLELLHSFGASTGVAIDNAHMFSKAQMEALTDNLTGLYNHRYFYKQLKKVITNAKNGNPVSLMMMDLDIFKLYNDLYGHYEGDEALKKVAQIIRNTVGSQGIAARYGGEEFAVLLPMHDSVKAYELAERIREQVQETFLKYFQAKDLAGFLTISIGVCTYPNNAPNGEELLKRADLALYRAKNNGKNQTVAYAPNNAASKGGMQTIINDASQAMPYATTIFALTAAIDAKDHFTFGHSQNVAYYTVALAKAMNLDQAHIALMEEAALLHDIGKIGIPENILSKPGRLTDAEYEIMKTHVDISVDIIKHLPSTNHVVPAIYCHHERWDGLGYPRGIKGEEIPIAARCLAIADAFDAMISQRPYKEILSTEYALAELESQAGKQFDPQLVYKFVQLVRNGEIKIMIYEKPIFLHKKTGQIPG